MRAERHTYDTYILTFYLVTVSGPSQYISQTQHNRVNYCTQTEYRNQDFSFAKLEPGKLPPQSDSIFKVTLTFEKSYHSSQV